MGARHQLFYALPQPGQVHSPGPLSPVQGACEGHKSGACFYGSFTPSFPPSNWIFLQLWQTYMHPPSLPHTPLPHTWHVHPQKQRAVRCVGARVCIYSDDCVLLLVVHPAIEPFTTRNSVPSVKRCGVCKLPRLLPASYHQISSGSMMRFSPVLTLGPALMSIKLKTFSINQVSIAIVVVLMDYCS